MTNKENFIVKIGFWVPDCLLVESIMMDIDETINKRLGRDKYDMGLIYSEDLNKAENLSKGVEKNE